MRILLNIRHLVLVICGISAVNANADLMPQNTLKPTIQHTNLASKAIAQKGDVFSIPVAKTANQDANIVDRLNSLASTTVRNFTQSGVASWYGRQFHGRKTANGETFNMNAMTAAHKTLPLNCMIRVTNKSNGKSVVVKVNDRGPFHGSRVVDLSYGAAKALGIVDTGTANVSIERIDN